MPIPEDKKHVPWLVDIHQIPVVTTAQEVGEPTPEGVHRDENEFVWIHLIKRKNLKGGINSIYANETELLKRCTLKKNMDAIVLWDPKVMHGVSDIFPKDDAKVGYRDVLLVGFTLCPHLQPPTGKKQVDYEMLMASFVDGFVPMGV